MLEAFFAAKVYENFNRKERFEDSTYGGDKKNDTSKGKDFNWIFLGLIFFA